MPFSEEVPDSGEEVQYSSNSSWVQSQTRNGKSKLFGEKKLQYCAKFKICFASFQRILHCEFP